MCASETEPRLELCEIYSQRNIIKICDVEQPLWNIRMEALKAGSKQDGTWQRDQANPVTYTWHPPLSNKLWLLITHSPFNYLLLIPDEIFDKSLTNPSLRDKGRRRIRGTCGFLIWSALLHNSSHTEDFRANLCWQCRMNWLAELRSWLPRELTSPLLFSIPSIITLEGNSSPGEARFRHNQSTLDLCELEWPHESVIPPDTCLH